MLASFAVSSVTVGGLLLLKRLFRKQLTASWHYRLWFLLLAALLIPLLPGDLLRLGTEWNVPLERWTANAADPAPGPATGGADEGHWLRDFTVSVASPFDTGRFDAVFFWIWAAGLAIFAVPVVRSWREIRGWKAASSPIDDPEALRLLERCKRRLGIAKDIVVAESDRVSSPMLVGVSQPYFVFPKHFAKWLSREEIEHIFLHELNHYKHKDNVTNALLLAYQLLYWYNPLVWLAFRHMRLDREIACDAAVLRMLDDRSYAEYGHTILNFADRASKQRGAVAWESRFASPRRQLKRRIEMIAAYTSESNAGRMKSVAVFLIAAVLVVCQAPLVAALSVDEERYAFAGERASYEDLGAYFADYDGTFVLYDARADRFAIHNKTGSERRISPDSTYKIYSALFGLDADVVTGDDSFIPWDGATHAYAAWNRDQDVFTAMKNSVNWYFKEIDARIGRDRLQAYLKRIGYGNADVANGADPFWLESSLKISPVEQVELLRSFYYNQLGFREEHVRIVKEAIRLETRGEARLFGKTGSGAVNGKSTNGWFVGYVETAGNTYFFAANVRGDDDASGSVAAEIALSILRDKGIY